MSPNSFLYQSTRSFIWDPGGYGKTESTARSSRGRCGLGSLSSASFLVMLAFHLRLDKRLFPHGPNADSTVHPKSEPEPYPFTQQNALSAGSRLQGPGVCIQPRCPVIFRPFHSARHRHTTRLVQGMEIFRKSSGKAVGLPEVACGWFSFTESQTVAVRCDSFQSPTAGALLVWSSGHHLGFVYLTLLQ